jgi:predicted ester cyclase
MKPEARENLAEETTPASTRDVVKKFIADIWNRGEVDLIPEICSTGLRFNGNTGFDRVGHDGLARMVGTIRDALDDYHCEIHSMVVENNKAFCRLRFTGRHTGSLLGYEPTNKIVAWMGATEFTCQNGKIVKVWELGDVKSLEEQLSNDAIED